MSDDPAQQRTLQEAQAALDRQRLTANRFGDWILTHSGRQFYPFDPLPVEVELADIAHALSQINRWTGHTHNPRSVAEHALSVAALVERLAPDLALAALHHDSAEAYIGDIASPVKGALYVSLPDGFVPIAEAEATLLRVIFSALQVPWPTEAGWQVIRTADQRVLVTEARSLMPPMPAGALDRFGVPPVLGLECGRMPYEVEQEFIREHERLRGFLP